jgi:hypothetical protein
MLCYLYIDIMSGNRKQNDPDEWFSRIGDNIKIVLSLYSKLLETYSQRAKEIDDLLLRNNSTRANIDNIKTKYEGPLRTRLDPLEREIQTLSNDFNNSKDIKTRLYTYLREQLNNYRPLTTKDIEQVIGLTKAPNANTTTISPTGVKSSRGILSRMIGRGTRHTKKRRSSSIKRKHRNRSSRVRK